MDSFTVNFDEKKEIEDVIKKFKKISDTITNITKLKAADAETLEALDKIIKNISDVTPISANLNETIIAASKMISQAKKIRIEKVKRYEAELINSLKNDDVPLREVNKGWRIGKLTLQISPEISKARIMYNEQEVVSWEPIASKESLLNLLEKGNKKLESLLIPSEELPEIVWEAYQRCSKLHGERNGAIPVKEYLIEFRLTLIKMLLCKNPGAKISKYLEFPVWAFLYNLDVYRSIGKSIPDGKRIGFQTGSQAETSANKGLAFGGLNPKEDLRIYCYIISLGG